MTKRQDLFDKFLAALVLAIVAWVVVFGLPKAAKEWYNLKQIEKTQAAQETKTKTADKCNFYLQ